MKPVQKQRKKHRSRLEALTMAKGTHADRMAYQALLGTLHGHLRKIQSLQDKVSSRDRLIAGLQSQLAEERRDRIYSTSGAHQMPPAGESQVIPDCHQCGGKGYFFLGSSKLTCYCNGMAEVNHES